MSDFHYASFGKRFLAAFIDGFLLFIPCVIANHLIPFLGGPVVFFLYAPILESSEVQATLGKYWLGIQVCTPSGNRISLRTGFIRASVKFVSSVLLFMGHLVALFTDKRQAVHDLLAETIVVEGRNSQHSLGNAWIQGMKRLLRVKADDLQ